MDQKDMEKQNTETQQTPQGNEPWRSNVRVAIYALAGVYLLTLAFDLFHAIESSRGNTQLIMIVAAVVFTIIGLGLVIWGMTVTYRNAKERYDQIKKASQDE